MILQFLGFINYSLKKFNDVLGYFNRVNKILGRLQEEGNFRVYDIKFVFYVVQFELVNIKIVMGRREEVLENLRNFFEIKEFLLGKDSREVGNVYRDFVEVYVVILNFKEGLFYCMKVLDVYIIFLGDNSVEVVYDRRFFGVIYIGMEEYEKVLEQNQLLQKVLKSWGRNFDFFRVEIDVVNMQIVLGRFDLVINILKGVVQ